MSMGVVQEIKRSTSKRTKRLLKQKEPKIIENVKRTLLIRGRKSQETISNFFNHTHMIKKPHCVLLSKKHDIVPFEDIAPVEKLCRNYNASLFVFGSHSKKRPNNLILGRMFNHQLLDAFEFGVESFRGLTDFNALLPSVGLKPTLVFAGEQFETVHTLKRLKSALIDLFHQTDTDVVHANNIEYVIAFFPVDNKVLLRTYRISLKNVGETSPRVDLQAMGPFADLVLRRNIVASDDLFKKALKKPKTKGKKIKNVRRDDFGNKLGRMHMTSQDVRKLQTRKMKGLKKIKSKSAESK